MKALLKTAMKFFRKATKGAKSISLKENGGLDLHVTLFGTKSNNIKTGFILIASVFT